MQARLMRPAFAMLLLALTSACEHSEGGGKFTAPAGALSEPGEMGAIPLGDLAGGAGSTLASTIPNPYHGPEAIQRGETLFRQMNCAGCHGYTAEGAMGPDLTDTYWRYGGTPAEIYKSIYEGRPQGMPAWGRALPAREIWEVVAYIESLGGSFPAADYQAARQGDKRHENAAPETREKAE